MISVTQTYVYILLDWEANADINYKYICGKYKYEANISIKHVYVEGKCMCKTKLGATQMNA